MSEGRELQTHTDLNSVSLPELANFIFLKFRLLEESVQYESPAKRLSEI